MSRLPTVDVSIIIVNWNTCQLLRECLRSVFQATNGVSFEVIVVDNGSLDDSVSMVRREFGGVRVIANTENVGFAAANNQGIRMAAGRHVLLLNSDTIVLEGALEATVAFADMHEDAAVVGCRVLNPDRTLQNTCFMFPSLLNLALFASYLYRVFPRSRFFGREQMSWWARDDVRDVEVVTGCFMLVRHAAIEAVGMMDERFFMYAEETDWCYRFNRAGWRCCFTPHAEIIHLGGGSAPKLSARRALTTNQSFVTYMFKHWPRWRAIIGVYLIAAFYGLRLPVAAVSGASGALRGRMDLHLANHWTGLRDILTYKRYLASPDSTR